MGKQKPKTYRKERNHVNLTKKLKTIESTTNLINDMIKKAKKAKEEEAK
jgi:hypothetical protein